MSPGQSRRSRLTEKIVRHIKFIGWQMDRQALTTRFCLQREVMLGFCERGSTASRAYDEKK
jgi:hypothetical protein